MKLCKDCKSCKPPISGIQGLPFTYRKHYDTARCFHPEGETEHINYVTGDRSVSHISCQQFRVLSCGPEGKYWEPSEEGK